MRRILITGGCGFVGTNLAARLKDSGGYSLTALDSESLGTRAALDGLDVTFVQGDIRDASLVDRLVADCDAVVHLAADTRVIESVENPEYNFDVNVSGTFNILNALRRHGNGRRLINASTGGAILGEVPPPVHEEMVPRPESPYGASKLAVEGYCSAFAGAYGVPSVSLRFSNVYGPRSIHKGSVVAHFFKRILAGGALTVYGDGSQVRDYVHVQDIADGIVRALGSDYRGVVQLGTGRPTTINELIAEMSAVVGGDYAVDVRYEPARAGEIHATYCDISRAREVLGYSPETRLREGLASTWAWFLDNKNMFAT